jgi:carbamoyltransferase
MKFLGIHTGNHDANFTYTDGDKVQYIKPERFRQIKHFYYKKNIHMIFDDLLKFGIDPYSLDAVCVAQFYNESLAEGKHYHKHDGEFLDFRCPVYSINHHYSHALSCFPFDNYDQITKSFVIDGQGVSSGTGKLDFESTTVFDIDHKILKKQRLPEQWSMGYGLFEVGEHWKMPGMGIDWAGKLMSFQSYGVLDPLEVERLNKFNIDQLREIFANPPSEPNADWLRVRHNACERLIPELFQTLAQNNEIISYSGGVAQNIIINSKIKKWNPNIIIPPHCGDEGISLGCVELLRQIYQQEPFDVSGFPYWQQDQVTEIPTTKTIKKAAECIAQGKIIGWCQGPGEIGPRALGNRSILMRADIEGGKDKLNLQVKNRESYRPFGCSVLLEDAQNHLDCDFESPYMLYSVPVIDKSIPSVTHVDGTTRPQTVRDGVFAELLHEVKKLTGTSLVLNTSLNVNGFPIANPEIAKTIKPKLDSLFIGNEIV